MKYGMPTLIEYDSIEENVLLCKHLGLDFVELNMSMLYCLPALNNALKINRLKEKYNVDFTMHFPEDIDFGTFHPEIRQANIELFKRYATYGKSIGVKLINIHLNVGVRVTLPHKKVFSYEKSKEQYIENLKESLTKIIKIGQENNIMVCIENVETPDFILNVYYELAKIPNLYFTYDIGHDAKENYSVEPIYKRLNEKVKHMHLHDFDQRTDHQILFKGVINIHDRLSFAKRNDMTVVIEVKTSDALMKSVENLKIRKIM